MLSRGRRRGGRFGLQRLGEFGFGIFCLRVGLFDARESGREFDFGLVLYVPWVGFRRRFGGSLDRRRRNFRCGFFCSGRRINFRYGFLRGGFFGGGSFRAPTARGDVALRRKSNGFEILPVGIDWIGRDIFGDFEVGGVAAPIVGGGGAVEFIFVGFVIRC